MSALGVLVALAVTLVALLVAIWLRRITAAWFVFRGHRLVTCPENQQPAGVALDFTHAAWTAAGGNPDLRLTGCTRWPDRSACDQGCLAQVRSSPADCLPENVLTSWYEGKCCAWCGDPVGPAYWTACKPVVLTGSNVLMEWEEIPIQQVPDVLANAVPVCFSCYARANSQRLRGDAVLGRHE